MLHIWNIILFLLVMMACSQRMEVGGRSCVSHYKRFRITCPQIDNHPAALLVMHIPEPLETTVVYSVSNEGKLVPRTSFWSPKVCRMVSVGSIWHEQCVLGRQREEGSPIKRKSLGAYFVIFGLKVIGGCSSLPVSSWLKCFSLGVLTVWSPWPMSLINSTWL